MTVRAPRGARARAVAAAALVVAAAVSGCSGSDAPRAAATPSTAPTATAGPMGCALLGAADRERLTGVAVDKVTDAGQSAQRAQGAQCRWEGAGAYVQVSSLDAAQWAKALPTLIASLEGSERPLTRDDRAELDGLTALLEKQGLVTSDEACRLFPRLATVAGGDGSAVLVTYVPSSGGSTGVQAQTCTDGVFTSVVFSGPGVLESAAVTGRARAGLDVAHQKALTQFDDSSTT